MESKEPIILCEPRVASRFFILEIFKKTGIQIEKTHDVNFQFLDNFEIVGIVRDPAETIASKVAMSHFLNYSSIPNATLKLSDNFNWQNFIDGYIEINQKIIEKANIIITYKDIVENTEIIVDKIIEKFNIIKNEQIRYDPRMEIKSTTNGYLVSSKESPEYENVYAKVLEQDLSKAYDIYNKAIGLKLSISK
jgi:hypothetical protein